MTAFQKAVLSIPQLTKAYRTSLGAISGKDKKRFSKHKNPKAITGSINLDEAWLRIESNANRWDYGVGLKETAKAECVVWIEVHSAITGEVATMLKKLAWLKGWLRTKAPTLNQMTHSNSYIWIASAGNNIPKHTPQYRQLVQSGLRFEGSQYQLC